MGTVKASVYALLGVRLGVWLSAAILLARHMISRLLGQNAVSQKIIRVLRNAIE